MRAPPLPVVGLDWRFRVSPSGLHGLGLFAEHAFAAGDVVTALSGQIVTIADVAAIREAAAHRVPHDLLEHFLMECNYIGGVYLLARPLRTIYGYINHSRHPNCEIRGVAENGSLHVAAATDIHIGDEFTLDYRREELPREYLTGHGSTYL